MSGRQKAYSAVAVIGVLLGIGWAIGQFVPGHGSGSDATQVFHLRTPPAEFLYLDSPRLLNYQIQLEGGRAGAARRITKAIHSANGEASVGGFKVGASAQREDEVESTLAPAASSELGVMLRDLREDTWNGVSVHDVNLNVPSGARSLREGWLVRFSTRNLLSPGYIRPYVVVRQSATLAALFPRGTGGEAAETRASEQRTKAKAFAKQIGPNPRITFAVGPPVRPGEHGQAVKILMPMQYGDLTHERSMLERGGSRYTGGHLVVVGKVIRVYPGRAKPANAGGANACPRANPACGKSAHAAYTDYATREIWKGPLEEASNFLINQVSHSCKAGWGAKEKHPQDKPQMRGRHCYLTRLRRQTRLSAPGVVILPLAIYK